MNAIAFFIILTLHLPMQIQSASLTLKKTRPVVSIVKDVKSHQEIKGIKDVNALKEVKTLTEVKTLKEVKAIKEVKSKKPPCGPVPFPDFSCEEVTTCVTVTAAEGVKDIDDDGPLHKRYETTCMMIDMLKKSALRQGPERIEFIPREEDMARQSHTTSTMAPFLGGTTPEPIMPSTVDTKCKGLANCMEWKWKK